MTCKIQGSGPNNISLRRDEYGYRWYTVDWLVVTDAPGQDLAATAAQCPGLPTPGSTYALGSESDLWCTCSQSLQVEPWQTQNETTTIWKVTQTFTDKNPIRCMLTQQEDPLLEPPQITINGVRYQEEAFLDRFGQPIINSAWERLRGKQVEFDRNRLAITIKQNVPTAFFGYQLPATMLDTVNTAPIWGMPARTVKLSDMTCALKYFHACAFYYERSLKFDLDSEGFDRLLLDEGQKVLIGHYATLAASPSSPAGGVMYVPGLPGVPAFVPNANNPNHFQRHQDIRGNNTTVILNGAGYPASVPVGSQPTGSITNVVNNGSGLCRVTSASHGRTTGDKVTITGVNGATGANGNFTITVIDSNTFDLQGSTFGGTYTSGGTWTLQLDLSAIYVNCCAGVPIAQTMTVSFTGLPGTYTATWNGANWTFDGTLGSFTPGPGKPAFTIFCSTGLETWFLELANGLRYTPTITTCANPLLLTFGSVDLTFYGVAGDPNNPNGVVNVTGGTANPDATTPTYEPGLIDVSKYPESDFTLLGVPVIF